MTACCIGRSDRSYIMKRASSPTCRVTKLRHSTQIRACESTIMLSFLFLHHIRIPCSILFYLSYPLLRNTAGITLPLQSADTRNTFSHLPFHFLFLSPFSSDLHLPHPPTHPQTFTLSRYTQTPQTMHRKEKPTCIRRLLNKTPCFLRNSQNTTIRHTGVSPVPHIFLQ